MRLPVSKSNTASHGELQQRNNARPLFPAAFNRSYFFYCAEGDTSLTVDTDVTLAPGKHRPKTTFAFCQDASPPPPAAASVRI